MRTKTKLLLAVPALAVAAGCTPNPITWSPAPVTPDRYTSCVMQGRSMLEAQIEHKGYPVTNRPLYRAVVEPALAIYYIDLHAMDKTRAYAAGRETIRIACRTYKGVL